MNKQNLIVCNQNIPKSLIALNSNEANKGAWNEIAKTGKWKGHSAGPFELTLEDLQTIVANFENAKATEIVVDYEHMSLYGTQAEAAGWLKKLKVEGDTLLGKIEWLDDAKKQIKSKKYKYLSPVLNPHTIDQESGEDIGWSLHSVALTNKPFFEELDEVRANKNQTQNKEDKLSKQKLEELEEENKKLKQENQDLKEENKKLKEKEVETKVDAAVAARKVSPEQKDSLLAFGATDPAGLDKFLEGAKPQGSPFSGDEGMYVNSQNGGSGQNQKYDVLKLAGVK